MTLSIQQFTESLTRSRLLTVEELSRFRQSLPQDEQPADARGLAVELVRSGLLTRYQATFAYRGKAGRLLFGQYVILDKLGAGGMGMVFRARHRRMLRDVAIKILPPEALRTQELVDRFHREVQAIARLKHPNIVTAYDAGVYKGNYYLVMEHVGGRNLASLLREKGRLSLEQAIDCTIQAARGLQHAHTRRVVHRDIKPANLLLDPDGTVKILDMGLARLAGRHWADGLTKPGQIMGTVDFMSPEQARDIRNTDARSDVYSLGCTLYTLLTGQSVYPGETLMNMMMAHCEQPVPSLRDARDDVPVELDLVVRKMLAKLPDDRQQSMNEVIADLQACRNPQAASSRPTAPRLEESEPAPVVAAAEQPAPRTSAAVGQSRRAAATGSTNTTTLEAASQDTTPETPRTPPQVLTGRRTAAVWNGNCRFVQRPRTASCATPAGQPTAGDFSSAGAPTAVSAS